MGNIYKRGKYWYLDLRVKGRRIRKRVGSSKEIATLALRDAEVKAARDEFGFAKNDIAIDQFFDLYLEYSRVNHQQSTVNRYRAVIDHFRRFLGGNNKFSFMSEINAELIDRYKVFRKDAWVNPNGQRVDSDSAVTPHTRRGARAHTINFEVGALRTIFNLAIKWDYIKVNPTKGVTKLKVNDSKPPRFLSQHECKKFLQACPSNLYPIYFTFLNTGMRKGELENLEWSDIDFRRRKIAIKRKEDWQPKTGEREIPMNDALVDLLQRLRPSKTMQKGYVFSSSDGGKLKTKLREKLIQIAKKAELKDLTRVHTLRHTFASQLVMSGVDLPTVMKLMGHSDIQTTMIYAHLSPDHLSDAVNKLSFSK